jgi:ribose-phosphate pyrophosphokinase
MTRAVLLTLDGNAELRNGLLSHGGFDAGDCEVRHFPDGESYVRVLADCRDRDVVVQCGLQQPDRIVMPLMFCVDTARELGARSVGLVAPYLAYMRQDLRFSAGESVSARLFARHLSAHVDWLLTVDPHLHRYHDLADIYSIPCAAVSATPALAQWIEREIANPLLIGPDSESEQWVSAVAAKARAPFTVLSKTRHGDREVEVSMPDVERWRACTPVLVDDIISTGHTLLETVAQLRQAGMAAPVCVAVHGLFAEHADSKLRDAGVARIVTTNSVMHATNAVDLSSLLAQAASKLMVSQRT